MKTMNVGELRKALVDVPDDLEIRIYMWDDEVSFSIGAIDDFVPCVQRSGALAIDCYPIELDEGFACSCDCHANGGPEACNTGPNDPDRCECEQAEHDNGECAEYPWDNA